MSDVKRIVREGKEYWDRICGLKRYGFIHSQDNSRVLKVEGIGSWIDMYEAQNVVDAAQDEVNSLKAENESLRKDAERYRWLRYGASVILSREVGFTAESGARIYSTMPSQRELDSAVDAAISSPENP